MKAKSKKQKTGCGSDERRMMKDERAGLFIHHSVFIIHCFRILSFAFCLLIFSSTALAQQGAQNGAVVDQIIALVNEDAVTRTDLLWSLALKPEAADPAGPLSSDILLRELDILIEQKMIDQEAARLPAADVTESEIAKRRGELISRFPSEAVFRRRVESVGLTSQRIDGLIRELILRERFVEFRFRSFVLVTDADIKKYYDETFARRLREAGQVPPTLDQILEKGTVRDQIREILRAEKINQEYERWISTARQRADVVVLAEP